MVGVNRYRPDADEPVELLDIDTTAVREADRARLAKVRAGRDEDALPGGARGAAPGRRGRRQPARAVDRGGAGQSHARRDLRCHGARIRRWRAEIRSISGVYGAAFREDKMFEAIQQEVEAFADAEGAGRASSSRSSARTATIAAPR